MNSICIFNNGMYDIEIRTQKYKNINKLKNSFYEIEGLYVDLINETIFIKNKNTISSIEKENCIYKSYQESLKSFQEIIEEEQEEKELEEIEAKTLNFKELIKILKEKEKKRIIMFEPIAYTTY